MMNLGLGQGGLFSGITQGITGIGQMIGGAIKSKKAKELEPSMEDPEQRSALTGIKQRLSSASTGTDPLTQQAIRQSDQMMQTTQKNISSGAGGNAGAALAGMLKSQRVGGQNINDSLARARQMVPGLLNLQTGMQNQMAQRKLELQMRRQNQMKAEAEALKSGGMQNLMGAGESLFGGMNKSGGGMFGGLTTPMQKKSPQPISTGASQNDLAVPAGIMEQDPMGFLGTNFGRITDAISQAR